MDIAEVDVAVAVDISHRENLLSELCLATSVHEQQLDITQIHDAVAVDIAERDSGCDQLGIEQIIISRGDRNRVPLLLGAQ